METLTINNSNAIIENENERNERKLHHKAKFEEWLSDYLDNEDNENDNEKKHKTSKIMTMERRNKLISVLKSFEHDANLKFYLKNKKFNIVIEEDGTEVFCREVKDKNLPIAIKEETPSVKHKSWVSRISTV